MSDADKARLDILRRAFERMPEAIAKDKLPSGVSVHAIEQSTCLGAPRSLEGALLVELPDGSLHRLTGQEMSERNEALAPFVKSWRLSVD